MPLTSDDKLSEAIVLKGGNAIDLAYRGRTRLGTENNAKPT
ncbi:hypothetical protein GCM10022406_27620 [Hymenobacter algoricola]|uniref:Uncharacterized protein n=1 Tax=Hymenobacter algoricola TaxID=486267 RepID=A0ABP7NE11_9BACT